jgi:hypothetical protein
MYAETSEVYSAMNSHRPVSSVSVLCTLVAEVWNFAGAYRPVVRVVLRIFVLVTLF